MTNDQITELWLSAQRSEHTREAYASDIMLMRRSLDKPFPEVVLRDLQLFQARLAKLKSKLGKPYAPKTQQRILTAVKSLFAFASEEGLIESNPARRLKLIKCQDSRGARVLDRAAIDGMIGAATSQRDMLILQCLFFSGARVSEITGLCWQDVQPNPNTGGQLALFGKGSENRTVGITATLYADLMAYREAVDGQAKGRVFTSQKDNGKMSRQQIYRIVKKAAKASGANWAASPHWFRHSHATIALENGASLRLIQKGLGHRSLETTQIYLDINPTESAASYL